MRDKSQKTFNELVIGGSYERFFGTPLFIGLQERRTVREFLGVMGRKRPVEYTNTVTYSRNGDDAFDYIVTDEKREDEIPQR
jgi:hypothetical protein